MTWSSLTARQKEAATRQAIEKDGLTYRQAAERLGTTRNSIAGVVDRNRIHSTNSDKRRRTAIMQEKARRARAAAKAPPKPKKPHQGFVKFVGAGEVTDAAPVKASAWDALPGSTPVSLDQRAGCSWPIGADSPFLFCDLPVQEGKSWCAVHYAMGARVVAVGTPVRRAARPDRSLL